MEAIYAGLITVLFSAWVWDLKSQVATGRRGGPTGRVHTATMRSHPADVTASDVSHIVKPNPLHVSKARKELAGGGERATEDESFAGGASGVHRQNGVPVWVIE